MNNAELIIDAIDTATTLMDAFVQWLIVLAVTGSILVIAAVACGAWGIRAVMEALNARERDGQPGQAPREPCNPPGSPQRRTGRRTPTWAHSQPLDYEEAA